jgi:hypothetical protein
VGVDDVGNGAYVVSANLFGEYQAGEECGKISGGGVEEPVDDA